MATRKLLKAVWNVGRKSKTKYYVHVGNDIARFSNLRHAYEFAILMSDLLPRYLIEVNAKDGIIGQYRDGHPTSEFDLHHASVVNIPMQGET